MISLGFGAVDFHTHIGDVCRGAYARSRPATVRRDRVVPSLLDRTHFHPVIAGLVQSSIVPRVLIERGARQAASVGTAENLVAEMARAVVARSVVLPVEPFSSTAEVLNECRQFPEELVPLLSIDFQRSGATNVRLQLKERLSAFPFKGIKFHPNLQGVDPGSRDAQDLYEAAAAFGLFVLMHGGRSPLGRTPDLANAQGLPALLKNHPRTRFVIAHAGNYLAGPTDFLKEVAEQENVSVDTSAVHPRRIALALRVLGPRRVLMGSDWPYSTQAEAVGNIHRAMARYGPWAASDEAIFRRVCRENALEFLR